MIPVKVCCIQSVDEARLAIAAGAHAIGLVAEMPSGVGPITDERIQEISSAIGPPTHRFLLTAETEADAIIAHQARTGVDTLQLVDRVEIDTLRTLRVAMPKISLVKVVHMQSESDVQLAIRAAPFADALLLDTGNPFARTKVLGGTGQVHDWDLSAAVVAAVDRPVYLAGGLNPDNVGAAIKHVGPDAVDLCNGVRTEGCLDEAKLSGFMQAVRRASEAK